MKYSSGLVTDLLYLNVFNLFDESEILKRDFGFISCWERDNGCCFNLSTQKIKKLLTIVMLLDSILFFLHLHFSFVFYPKWLTVEEFILRSNKKENFYYSFSRLFTHTFPASMPHTLRTLHTNLKTHNRKNPSILVQNETLHSKQCYIFSKCFFFQMTNHHMNRYL